MVKIIWHTEAERLLNRFVENAYLEFGASTAKKWHSERLSFEWRLARHPESYPPEELLTGGETLYRRCQIMNRRFKIIYHYNKENDIAYIDDIWDTKQNPKTLIKRIK